MEFATPAVTVVPLIIQEGRLKAVLLRHTNPRGEAKLRLVRGDVDPDRDPDLDFCARRLLDEELTTGDAGIVECDLATGRDTIGEMREDVDGNLATPAWGVRALYAALLRPSNMEAILNRDVDLFEIKSVYTIAPFADEEGGLEIAGRGIDSMTLAALKLVEAIITQKAQVTKLPAFLVEREFTLSELQEAYEAASGLVIDPANFRRKTEQIGMVQPVGERRGISRRPTTTYVLLGADVNLNRNIFGSGSRAMTV